jgi:hypothetical protein
VEFSRFDNLSLDESVDVDKVELMVDIDIGDYTDLFPFDLIGRDR